MPIEPGSEEEQLLLATWIKRGRDLIIATSPLGESYLDPNVKRDPEVQKVSEAYVAFDHDTAEKLPHLKGRFRWDLENIIATIGGRTCPRMFPDHG